MSSVEGKKAPAISSLENLTKELHKAFENDKVDVAFVKALLEAYKSNPKDWKMYAIFDPVRYTRNLVDSGNGKFNLIALCWGEGQGSKIHDHSDAHCFVKILDGQLKETLYDWPKDETNDQEMALKDTRFFGKDGVTYINDSIGLHRMENPSHSDKTVSLHLYSPPFDVCQTFDDRTGRREKAMVTFYSKYGQRTEAEMAGTNECSEVRKTCTGGAGQGN